MNLFKKKKGSKEPDIAPCTNTNENNNECMLLKQLKEYQDEYKNVNSLKETYSSNLKQKSQNKELTNIVINQLRPYISHYGYIEYDEISKIISAILSYDGIEVLSQQYKEEKLKYDEQNKSAEELTSKIKELKDNLGID